MKNLNIFKNKDEKNEFLHKKLKYIEFKIFIQCQECIVNISMRDVCRTLAAHS